MNIKVDKCEKTNLVDIVTALWVTTASSTF